VAGLDEVAAGSVPPVADAGPATARVLSESAPASDATRARVDVWDMGVFLPRAVRDACPGV
jgi:hypothetical protein